MTSPPGASAHPPRAQLVIVSDLLPSGSPDLDQLGDPVTSALSRLVDHERAAWLGRIPDPPRLDLPFPQSTASQSTASPEAAWPGAPSLRRVGLQLDPDDVAGYQRFAPSGDWRWYEAFRRVSYGYALAAARQVAHGSWAWIHGERLLLVPGMLRRLRPDLRIGLFLPYGGPNVGNALESHLESYPDLIHGMLGADVIGFADGGVAQTFARLVRTPRPAPPADLRLVSGPVKVGVYPTSRDTWARLFLAALCGPVWPASRSLPAPRPGRVLARVQPPS